jgi:hypothetical protein
LLTIPEIYTFARTTIANRGTDNELDLVDLFDPSTGQDPTIAMTSFLNATTPAEISLRCNVLKAILLTFQQPMDLVNKQWTATVGQLPELAALGGDGYGKYVGSMSKLAESTNRLSMAAQLLVQTFDANGKVEKSVVPEADTNTSAAAASPAPTPSSLFGAPIDAGLGETLQDWWRGNGGGGKQGSPGASGASSATSTASKAKPPDKFCDMEVLESSSDWERAIDGICAGLTQLREDGGMACDSSRTIVRAEGINPFYPGPRPRALARNPQIRDAWDKDLWPLGKPGVAIEPQNLPKRLDQLQRERIHDMVDLATIDAAKAALTYATVRGLCAKPPPHFEKLPSDDAQVLIYSLPRASFAAVENVPEKLERTDAEQAYNRTAFADTTYSVVQDFVTQPRTSEQEMPTGLCRWVPAIKKSDSVGGAVFVYDYGDKPAAVGEAVVYEHLVDYFKAAAYKAPEETRKYFLLGCAAAAKLRQLPSMATVFRSANLSALCKQVPYAQNAGGTYTYKHVYITRPVIECPDRKALYPCDAGLYSIVVRKGTDSAGNAWQDPVEESQLPPQELRREEGSQPDQMPGMVSGDERPQYYRNQLTSHMRAALVSDLGGGVKEPLLYVAAPPGENDRMGPLSDLGDDTKPRDFEPEIFPLDASDVTPDKLQRSLRLGLRACERIDSFDAEEKFVDEKLEELKETVSGVDDNARERREAVWNDALREACIAGDRLYSFVRQLSGTISENVDAICQIDEGLLIRQQSQIRDRRARIADRAAEEHMQLVRNVFTAVIRESGLTLGIDPASTPGDVGQLKVVSNTLRKQMSDLAQQGGQGEGFFANSVRLEQLLSKGTGEMTLSELFKKLQEAGTALQRAANAVGADQAPGGGASLDFLSAPRNSLMLRYKPEALAAMRQAFDVFQREMLAQHGRMYRTITAYELIEGNDESLCSAFAQLSAHMLVHSRMYSSATAMYVAAWPAAANAQQLKVSLQRLVRIACQYLAFTEAPNFLSPAGRGAYFRQPDAPMGLPVAPPMILRPRGLWSWNMTGSS